jgi:hypothetical protein
MGASPFFALQSGLLAAPKTAAVGASATTTDVLETQQAKPVVVFDYPHWGAKGAAQFSVQVTQELAQAVPELRKDLIP